MSQEPMYVVRDAAGAMYGPANVGALRQWIAEGRITAQMQVALQGTQDYRIAGEMPELADAFAGSAQLAPTTVQGTVVDQPAGPYGSAYGGAGNAPAFNGPLYVKSSSLAVSAMVCGIVGILVCPLLAFFAVIMGHIARGQIRRQPERYDGAGMALAGMILGYVVIAIWLVVLAIYVIFFVILIGAAAAGSR
jgi:hypothetical protein